VLYTGVTNDLVRRVYEHREKLVAGFTKKYNLYKLVYYEVFEDIEQAILREKQIKAGSRVKKTTSRKHEPTMDRLVSRFMRLLRFARSDSRC